MKRTASTAPVPPKPDEPQRGRVLLLWGLSVALFLLIVLSIFLRTVLESGRIQPAHLTGEYLFLLSILNIVLILVLLFILLRDLIKLALERRRKILGSQFRTKLVLASIGLTLIPSGFIFFVAFDFIRDSVSQWFNTDLESVLSSTQQAVDGYLEAQADRCRHLAGNLARELEQEPWIHSLDDGPSAAEESRLQRECAARLKEYRLNCLILYRGLTPIAWSFEDPISLATLDQIFMNDLVRDLLSSKEGAKYVRLDEGMLVLAGKPLAPKSKGGWHRMALVSGVYVPPHIGDPIQDVVTAHERYERARAFKEESVRVYYFTFLLITLVILFAAVWVGRTLAKEITVPIQMLAEGTREVSSGNLNYKVRVKAGDEIGILVNSFNRMTEELRISKSELEAAAESLQQTNLELDERGQYMGTVLENITTGVFSLDPEGRVTTINRSAREILRLDPDRSPAGDHFGDILADAELSEIRETIARAAGLRGVSVKKELTVGRGDESLNLAMTLTALSNPDGGYGGMVVVIDDLTQLITAQRSAAWQEVARRMAHEIKNPLTPIQLSAQRIRRKVAEGGDCTRLVDECTAIIQNEVKTLKGLVDEFTRYARMPLMSREDVDLHEVIDSAIGLYDGTHRSVRFDRAYDTKLPACSLDPEQIRRALVNLIDNAIQAVTDGGRIEIRTEYRQAADRVRISITDDGPGIPAGARDKLFVPYFSTKEKGTGLGLAIVHRIVSDHGGTIRLEDNSPRGTRVVVELPV